MLVHESRGPAGAPTGLQLAFSTPHAWLADGKSIIVRNAPTSFGPVSYSIARKGKHVRIVVDPPPSLPLRLELRLRLPSGERIASVGAAFDRVSGTIELPHRNGEITLDATLP